MGRADYPAPVARLVALGYTMFERSSAQWPDYTALGVGQAHVATLIRIATDETRYDHFGDSKVAASFAPIHACRALGQLRAAEAAEPLVAITAQAEREWRFSAWKPVREWLEEELPEVVGLIGPPALPALARCLHSDEPYPWARALAADGLARIAEREPAARDECVAHVMQQFTRFADTDPWLNAMLTFPLVQLKAREAAPIIERAFAAQRIDTMVAWELPLIR